MGGLDVPHNSRAIRREIHIVLDVEDLKRLNSIYSPLKAKL